MLTKWLMAFYRDYVQNARMKNKEPVAIAFGRNLLRIRTARKLSQGKLAVLLGYSPINISRYENGHKMPTLGAMVNLSKALKCELSDLVRDIS